MATSGSRTPTFSFPIGITPGPDGNIWFTDLIGNKIWRLELPSRSVASFPVPTENSFPNDITVGADGNLWFTEGSAGKIGRITTSGVITEFGSGLSLPFSITNGPDGNVWLRGFDPPHPLFDLVKLSLDYPASSA
jgi:virginiamycin B lyase